MMDCEGLHPVKPTPEFEAEYTAMVREFLQTEEPWFNNFELALADFPAFVQELQDEAQGIGLPLDVVPQQTYWLANEQQTLLGEIRLRPQLTLPFEQHNGHIGYKTAPPSATKAMLPVLYARPGSQRSAPVRPVAGDAHHRRR